MSLSELKTKWIGKKVYGSTVDIKHAIRSADHTIENIWYSAESDSYCAWSGEHIRANTPEALNHRLHSLEAKNG